MSKQIELKVGKWSDAEGFVGDIVRFHGEKLADKPFESETMYLNLTLYKSGNGYCLYSEVVLGLSDKRGPVRHGYFVPTDDKGNYLLLSEEVARREFPELFHRAGLHPVKSVSFSAPTPRPAPSVQASARAIRVIRKRRNIKRRSSTPTR